MRKLLSFSFLDSWKRNDNSNVDILTGIESSRNILSKRIELSDHWTEQSSLGVILKDVKVLQNFDPSDGCEA